MNRIQTQVLSSGHLQVPPPVPSAIQAICCQPLPQIPVGSIVHLSNIHEGENKLLRNIQEAVTPYGTVRLFSATDVSSKPFNTTLSFNIKETEDGRMLRGFWGSKTRNRIGRLNREIKARSSSTTPEAFELYLNTFVIRYNTQLKTFIGLLYEIDVLGCTLEGENIGRNGKVSWVILTAKNTLIPLDISGLSYQTPKLWELLKTHIFSNDNIVKIFHDSRPAADYLYHRHGITLSNVFDTQVADAVVEKNMTGKPPPSYKPLSLCLALYNKISQEEFDYLQKYESFLFTTRSPWMIRPMPPQEILKLGALKVKHLVSLRENLIIRLLKRFNYCVQGQIEVIHSDDSSYFLENPSEMPNMVEAILLTETDP